MSNENCDVRTNWLIENLNETANKFIVEKCVRNDDDFFDSELEMMRKEKNRLYKIAQYSGNEKDWSEYRLFRNKYKQVTKHKRYAQMQKKLNEVQGDPKKTWKLLNSILKENKEDFDHIMCDETIIYDNTNIANEFNKYFVSAPIQINESIPYEVFDDNIEHLINSQFEFSPINTSDLKRCLIESEKKDS